MLVLLVVSALAVATATSCSKEVKLLGTWIAKDEGDTIELTFKKGGQGIGVVTEDGDSSSGAFNWTLDADKVVIKFYDDKESLTGTFNGNTIVIMGKEFHKKK